MWKLGILSVSVSIDALGIGFSYRMRGVKIGGSAKIVIGILTCMAMAAAMTAGKLLAAFLPAEVMDVFSTAFLTLIGLAMIRDALFGEEAFYDFDKSKKIEFGEALVLGLALSADAASFGLALSAATGGSFWLPVLSGFMHTAFLWLGELLFEKGVKTRIGGQKGLGVFAGGIIVAIAFLK